MANISTTLTSAFNGSEETVASINVIATRNLLTSSASFVVIFISAIMLILTRIRRPIKILLLNLLASDVMFMMSTFLYSIQSLQMESHFASETGVCYLVVFLLAYGTILNHAAIAGLTANNFIAIFYPYKYGMIFTTRKTVLALMVMWLGAAAINVGCVGPTLLPNIPCSPLVAVYRPGLFFFSTVLLICDISVIVMNTILGLRLRQRGLGRIGPAFNQLSVTDPTTKRAKPVDRIPLQEGSLRPKNTARDINTYLPSTSGNGNNMQLLSIPIDLSVNGLYHRRSQEHSLQVHDLDSGALYTNDMSIQNMRFNRQPEVNGVSVKTPEVNRPAISNISPTRNETEIVRIVRPAISSVSPRLNENHEGETSNSNSSDAIISSTPTPTTRNRGPPLQQQAASYSSRRFRRLSITMVIITLWCSVLNVPFLTFMFYMSIVAENRVETHFTDIGIVATSCIFLNILGDPFIYAWRFVNWTQLCNRIKYCVP